MLDPAAAHDDRANSLTPDRAGYDENREPDVRAGSAAAAVCATIRPARQPGGILHESGTLTLVPPRVTCDQPGEEPAGVSAICPAAVIVLAAGEGRRMKSRTPKVLHTLCGRSLLGH